MKIKCNECKFNLNLNKSDLKTGKFITILDLDLFNKQASIENLSYFICPLCGKVNFIKTIKFIGLITIDEFSKIGRFNCFEHTHFIGSYLNYTSAVYKYNKPCVDFLKNL